MPVPMLPQDKANHVLYGAAIFEVAVVSGAPLPIAVAITVVCAGLKELSDYLLNRRAVTAGRPPPHTVDPWDVVATVGGGVAMYVVNALA